MNRDNLRLLAIVLEDLPAKRQHGQGAWVRFAWGFGGDAEFHDPSGGSTQELRREETDACGTSACTAGHGALSGAPALEKRPGEFWCEYVKRVYGLEPESRDGDFAFSFGGSWVRDTVELARSRILHLVERGKAPPFEDWGKWGDWKGPAFY